MKWDALATWGLPFSTHFHLMMFLHAVWHCPFIHFVHHGGQLTPTGSCEGVQRQNLGACRPPQGTQCVGGTWSIWWLSFQYSMNISCIADSKLQTSRRGMHASYMQSTEASNLLPPFFANSIVCGLRNGFRCKLPNCQIAKLNETDVACIVSLHMNSSLSPHLGFLRY